MTPGELARIRAEASAEFAKDEEFMLVRPVLVLGLLDDLAACESARAAAGRYDELHGAVTEIGSFEDLSAQPHAYVPVPGSGPLGDAAPCNVCNGTPGHPLHT